MFDSRKPSILVVDSDLGNIATITLVVCPTHRVDKVLTATEAISRLSQGRFRLNIINLDTPHLDGVLILRAVRAHQPKSRVAVLAEKDDPEVFREVASQRVDGFFRHRAELWQWLPDALRFTPRGASRVARICSREIARALDYISRNYGREGTVAQIASTLGMSTSSLSHRFRAETGMPVKEYLMRVRVEAAKCLLTRTDHKLQLIAGEVGFWDSAHLCRVFRRYEAQTPTYYRSDGRAGARNVR